MYLKDSYPMISQSLSNLETCETCGGDGKETCNNPDHGFVFGVGGEIGRLGCPVCGHHPEFKVPNGGHCEDCDGTGYVQNRDYRLAIARALSQKANQTS